MLNTIIKREILEYLKSVKFLIGFLITVVLITVSTFINLEDFKQRQADYQAAKQELKSVNRTSGALYRAPEMLSILVQGKDRKLGNRIEVSSYDFPSRLSGYMGRGVSQHMRYKTGFEAVDFAFVVRVVLSLLVIFIAYNAVSEEKSSGTLRTALANSLPRDQLLSGKFIGGGAIVLGSLFIATLLALLIMISDKSVQLGGSDLARILGMFLVSALYLIFFYTLSLFISVRANRPATSLMLLLQVWIFLLIIYPNLGVFLAERLYRLPGEEEISSKQEAVIQPVREEINKTQADLMEARKNDFNSPQTKELSVKRFELSARRAELAHELEAEIDNQFTRQVELVRKISIFSSAVLYDAAMSRLARTGLDEYENFMTALPHFHQQLVERGRLMYRDPEAYRNSKPPEFSSSRESTARSFVGTAAELMLLFMFGIVLFSMAYISFLRKDVR
ncbi:MAG TPA: ABC transporter permease subunit [archaeon]|nr:ABC transporter permease subunit [archaeon]